jgi:hypothetical protein
MGKNKGKYGSRIGLIFCSVLVRQHSPYQNCTIGTMAKEQHPFVTADGTQPPSSAPLETVTSTGIGFVLLTVVVPNGGWLWAAQRARFLWAST